MFYFLKLILKIKATSVIKNPHHISYFLKPNRLYHYHYHTYGFVKKKKEKNTKNCVVSKKEPQTEILSPFETLVDIVLYFFELSLTLCR